MLGSRGHMSDRELFHTKTCDRCQTTGNCETREGIATQEFMLREIDHVIRDVGCMNQVLALITILLMVVVLVWIHK